MQGVGYVRRAGLAPIRQAFSKTQLSHQNWSSAASQSHQSMDSTALKTFADGKSFLPFHDVILSLKFYSTDALATFQIPEETQAASSKDEIPEFQALNSEEDEDTLSTLNKTDKTSVKKKCKLFDATIEICRVLEKSDEDMEKTLSQLGVHLTPGLVDMVLDKTNSLSSALRFFQWAKAQPGFKHNNSSYDKIANTLGSSKDFVTLQSILTDRFVERCKFSFKTFSFATAWHDDSHMLNEVMEMIEKLELSPRRYAYERLIGALSRKNHVNAALIVLERMASAGCAPNMHAYRPLIDLYCKKDQMEKVRAFFEMMKDCPQDSICYNIVLSALCNRKEFAEATEFLRRMVNMGCKPDATTYNTMIYAACETGRHQGALQLFDRMKQEGIKPLYGTYTHLLRGLFQNNGFAEAHSFLIQQSGKDPKLDSVNYTYLIRICRKSGQNEEADKLLMEKEAKGFGASDDQLR